MRDKTGYGGSGSVLYAACFKCKESKKKNKGCEIRLWNFWVQDLLIRDIWEQKFYGEEQLWSGLQLKQMWGWVLGFGEWG